MRNICCISIIMIICVFTLNILSFSKFPKLSLSLLWQVKQSKFAITDISFSPNSKLLASISRDYIIKIWNKNGKLVGTLVQAQKELTGEEDASVAWSPCGRFLASLYDYQVKIFDIKKLKCIQIFKCTYGADHGATSLKFSFDGKLLASNNGSIVNIWNIQQKYLVSTLKPIKERLILDIDFTPDGKLLALVGEIPIGEDKNIIEIYSVHNNKLVKLLRCNKSDITSVIFSDDNRYLISGSIDGTINIWLIPKWRLIKVLKINGLGISSISFSPQKILAVGTDDNKVILYYVPNLRKLGEIQVKGRWIKVTFSPNGKFLGIGDNKGWIYLYRLSL